VLVDAAISDYISGMPPAHQSVDNTVQYMPYMYDGTCV